MSSTYAQVNKGKAQTNLGVVTSLGYSLASEEVSFSADEFSFINHEVTYEKSNLVQSYGIFAQQKIGFLFARTELAYTRFKQEYTIKSYETFGQLPVTRYETFEFIDFRVMAGLNRNNARLGVGPVAHILVGNDDNLDFITNYNERHRGLTFGFLFTAGIDAGRLHIDLRFENNFRTVGDHIYFGARSAEFKNKPNVVQLVVAVSI